MSCSILLEEQSIPFLAEQQAGLADIGV